MTNIAIPNKLLLLQTSSWNRLKKTEPLWEYPKNKLPIPDTLKKWQLMIVMVLVMLVIYHMGVDENICKDLIVTKAK